MKIVQFKDGSYAIRKVSLKYIILGYSIFKYVRLYKIKDITYDLEFIIIKPNKLKTIDSIKFFENNLWESINENEDFELDRFCRTNDYELITKYLIFLTKKRYKNNLTKFDYGKAI